MKYIKEHWIVVSILLLSSLTGAFFNFQKLHDFLFPERTEIIAEFCAEREPFTICDDANTDLLELLYESSATGRSYKTNINYELLENSNDPCKPHTYLFDEFAPGFDQETKSYSFPFLTGSMPRFNDEGVCVDRLYVIDVPSEFVLVNEETLDQSYLRYIIVGEFQVFQRNQFSGITEFQLRAK